ncbi:MAG: DUF554 domain-containing protein [Lachnospiraceae bacterium]|jgi:uncharacterized membrane protein YqgA involved in biofilm formation|nr:DUF554 domain-containing protein [Lachnospiraceae bacterium]
MPIGVIINALVVVIGGIVGALAGDKISESFKENLNTVFGACAMAMGISSVVLMENMPAVVFSVIVGTSIGLAMHLGQRIDRAGLMMQKGIGRVLSGLQRAGKEQQELTGKISAAGQTDAVGKKDSADSTGTVGQTDTAGTADSSAVLVTALVLFCASGTGIYGSIVAGMTGDHSILLAKSILDFATALIFACSLGIVVSLIAVPQFLIFIALYLLAGMIYPLCTPAMINDFKASGGILLLATGFRMIKVKEFPVADMIPAMALAMPVSYLWTNYIMPLMG